ncbi:MAG: GyrI-like domain-containing protein [Devosia sp.]
MELVDGPKIETRPKMPTLGICEIVPFRGMISARARLWEELLVLLKARAITNFGYRFLRLNVVDMKGFMDIEAGVVTSQQIASDERLRSGEFPARRYATLTHRDHSIRANKMLFQWIEANRIALDRKLDPHGDRFGCRYELVLSDPNVERRRTHWTVQLDVRLAD